MKPIEFSVLGPLMGGFGSQAFLGCVHAEQEQIKPAVMVFLPDEIVEDGDLFRKVWAETELGTLIDHINVIGVMGLARLDEGYARVVEYADAESLRSVYRRATTLRKPISPHLACALIADACMGVHYAHELGLSETGEAMIHGGIRPDTLQVSFKGMGKVTGYGATTIAEVVRKSRGTDGARDAYTAPEQAFGGRTAVTVQTDVYALGCVLYEALTGKAPFAADNELAEAMIKDELARPQHEGITPAMAAVVLKATRRKAQERYATALEMRHDILEQCEPASEVDVRLFMDNLFPPETVPRATRDQMLKAAAANLPPPTGTLLETIPPELGRPTRALVRQPSDAEVEAAAGRTVETAALRVGSSSDSREMEHSSEFGGNEFTTDVATEQDIHSLARNLAPDTFPSASAHDVDTADGPSEGGSADHHPHRAITSPPTPAPVFRSPGRAAHEITDVVERRKLTAASRAPPSWSADQTLPPSPMGNYPPPGALDDSGENWTRPPAGYPPAPPPVVYRAPPGLLIAATFAGTLALVLLAYVFVLRPDPAPPPPVIVQAPPPPPAPAPEPADDSAAADDDARAPEGDRRAPRGSDSPKAESVKAPAGPGTLIVSAEPSSLEIFVDGKSVGKGSARWEGKPGRHKVMGRDRSLGATVTRTVRLRAGQTQNVALVARKGSLTFEQLPDGVDVFIDGKRIGKTPMANIELYAGPRKIMVKKGTATVSLNATIVADRELYITAEFP